MWYKNISMASPVWTLSLQGIHFDNFFESHVNHDVGIFGEVVDLTLMFTIITAKGKPRREVQVKHNSITNI